MNDEWSLLLKLSILVIAFFFLDGVVFAATKINGTAFFCLSMKVRAKKLMSVLLAVKGFDLCF